MVIQVRQIVLTKQWHADHSKQTTAARANAIDKPLLILRTKIAPLVELSPGEDPDVGADIADDSAVVPLAEEVEAGTMAGSASTVVHEAAALAALLPCVYGRKETVPSLVS
jgi:hypothetical protein